MTTDPKTMKRLKAAAQKAAEFADVAKKGVREAKAKLKHARKLLKAAKKVAKQARRKRDAASAAKPAPKPKPVPEATAKPQTKPKPAVRATSTASKPKRRVKRAAKLEGLTQPETMRSAAEVAKSVIERLHSPPPLLPPTPAIPAAEPGSESGS